MWSYYVYFVDAVEPKLSDVWFATDANYVKKRKNVI